MGRPVPLTRQWRTDMESAEWFGAAGVDDRCDRQNMPWEVVLQLLKVSCVVMMMRGSVS